MLTLADCLRYLQKAVDVDSKGLLVLTANKGCQTLTGTVCWCCPERRLHGITWIGCWWPGNQTMKLTAKATEDLRPLNVETSGRQAMARWSQSVHSCFPKRWLRVVCATTSCLEHRRPLYEFLFCFQNNSNFKRAAWQNWITVLFAAPVSFAAICGKQIQNVYFNWFLHHVSFLYLKSIGDNNDTLLLLFDHS